jgi:two-component sensor histidine kinase
VKKDGTPFWCRATSSTFDHPEHGLVLVAVQEDITERKFAQEKISTSLKEKEILLKEIHHRVKNNLQVITSLLYLQSHYTDDPNTRAMFRESQNRVRSMALVHEKLYQSDSLAYINFSEYVESLVNSLFAAYGTNRNNITAKISISVPHLDMDIALNCGLIINELVSNALKYGFPHGQSGEIKVALTELTPAHYLLIIEDNGVGFPAELDFRETETLGLQLVHNLTEQLKGSIEIDCSAGTQYKLYFSANPH